MMGEWKVSSNYVGDEKVFQVYRIRNADEVDHSGNREYAGGVFEDREAAASVAERMNLESVDEEKIEVIGPDKMMMLPPKSGTCPECAVKHDPEMPHDQQSLYYQTKFWMENGRYPTWHDAMEHCTDEVKELWTQALAENGVKI